MHILKHVPTADPVHAPSKAACTQGGVEVRGEGVQKNKG